MEKIYQVIIVGAGISGVGASRVLHQNGIQHLILESRDRIGGRIYSQQFDGVRIDIGASLVHQPEKNHEIVKMMKQLKWGHKLAGYEQQQYFYEHKGQIKGKLIDKAYSIYEKWWDDVERVAEKSAVDISVEQAGQKYFQNRIQKEDEEVKSLIKWFMNIDANVQGAELSQMSAKDEREDDETKHDYLPHGGYASLFQAIVNIHKPHIKLNQKVLEIDYSGNVTKITTVNNVYLCEKVISSLPLGVLKRGLVKFVPQLPERYRKSIENIGFGLANKIFVSFQTPFWNTKLNWINFVTKDQNKYPVAMTIHENNRNILCFFVSGNAVKQFTNMSDKEIVEDFTKFIHQFNIKQQIKIRDFLATRWERDEYTYGSYSQRKVGTTEQDFTQLKKPINKKLWLVGEHCNNILNSCVHSGFQTGLWAGQQVAKLIGKQ